MPLRYPSVINLSLLYLKRIENGPYFRTPTNSKCFNLSVVIKDYCYTKTNKQNTTDPREASFDRYEAMRKAYLHDNILVIPMERV